MQRRGKQVCNVRNGCIWVHPQLQVMSQVLKRLLDKEQYRLHNHSIDHHPQQIRDLGCEPCLFEVSFTHETHPPLDFQWNCFQSRKRYQDFYLFSIKISLFKQRMSVVYSHSHVISTTDQFDSLNIICSTGNLPPLPEPS